VKHTSPKRRLLLALRRRVKAHRRFAVEDLGSGRVRLTCRTCGTVTEDTPDKVGEAGARLLADWWGKRKTIGGTCETCTRRERDERYPLDKDEKP
jgi:hypothetical protein